jgi:hypothetical protein
MSNLVKKYFDVARLVIWGDGDEEGNRKPRLVFGFRDGNPRITVYTGQQGNDSVISFPSDSPTMISILTYMKDIAKSAPGTKILVESLTLVYENNRPTKEKKVISTLYIGKSKEGLVYLSVISENKPKLIFTIKPSTYHTFKDGDKANIEDSKISELMTIGIADTMLNIIGQILVQYSNDEYTSGIRKQASIKSANGNFTSTDPVKNEILQDLDDISI